MEELVVICPYCTKPAALVESNEIYGAFSPDYGKFWQCKPCGAYVGTHKNSPKHVPLGRLANKELRDWKKKAHAVFDPLWKSGRMSRNLAYHLLQTKMNMGKNDAHIGKFDVEQCKKMVELFTEVKA
jgi:hypothetical protein